MARLAARGHAPDDIARRLFLEEAVVDAYLAAACTKLGLPSVLDLILRAPDLDLGGEGSDGGR